MSNWKAMKQRLLEDEDRRAAYDELEERIRLVRAVFVARNARGWSQRDLARAAGLQQPAIARFEKAESDPRLGTVTKILNALQLQLTIDPDGIAGATAIKHERVTSRGNVVSKAPQAKKAPSVATAAARRAAQVGEKVRVVTDPAQSRRYPQRRTTEFSDVKTSGKGSAQEDRKGS